MSPVICQDPAAQLRPWGLQGTKGPTELRERGGAHTAPHQTETGLLLLQAPQGQRSQLMPEEEHQQGRATAGPSHAESTPVERRLALTPFCPGSLQGTHLPQLPATWLSASLWPSGPDTQNHSCPGTCHWARQGSPAWRPGPAW